MPEIDRRLLIATPIVILVVFLMGMLIGRATVGDSDAVTAEETPTTAIAGSANQGTSDPGATVGSDAAPESTTIIGDPTVVLPSPPPDPEDIPRYGTAEDRQALIAGLVEAGVTGGAEDEILATADYVCYTLERLQMQRRSLSFTVRVVWNESLAELPPEDLAAFGTVLAAAPPYLCPEYAAFGENVSYWLGY